MKSYLENTSLILSYQHHVNYFELLSLL